MIKMRTFKLNRYSRIHHNPTKPDTTTTFNKYFLKYYDASNDSSYTLCADEIRVSSMVPANQQQLAFDEQSTHYDLAKWLQVT